MVPGRYVGILTRRPKVPPLRAQDVRGGISRQDEWMLRAWFGLAHHISGTIPIGAEGWFDLAHHPSRTIPSGAEGQPGELHRAEGEGN
jgi:hypothetical protein